MTEKEIADNFASSSTLLHSGMRPSEALSSVYNFARQNFIPIMDSDCEEVLIELIKTLQPKNILEIGTAVGYSSALMVLNCPNTHIDTIEIDPQRAQMAQQLWTTLCIDDHINSIVGDVDQILSKVVQGKTYDFVFLDGPKSRYLQHLQAIESNICSGGIVLADDVLFFGMVKGEDYVAHKHRTIVKNLRVFLQYLESNNSFSTQLLDKGNGIAIIKKK